MPEESNISKFWNPEILGINRKHHSPLYLQLARSIEELIKRGRLPEGTCLPPERKLAELMGVSRITVTQATRLLEEEGFLTKIQGSGIFVGNACECPPLKADGSGREVISLFHNISLETSHQTITTDNACQYLLAQGYEVIKVGFPHVNLERVLIQYYINFIAGALYYPGNQTQKSFRTAKIFEECNIPYVIYGNSSIPGVNADFISSDDRKSVAGITRCLISSGHVRIVIIGGFMKYSLGAEREKGYRDAMEEAGLVRLQFPYNIDMQKNYSDNHFLLGYNSAMELLKRKPFPTAIMAGNSIIGEGVLKALFEMKIKVPDDVELIGLGDDIEANRYHRDNWPQISSVAVPREEIGRRAAEMLIERLHHPKAPFKTVKLATRMIHRGTTRIGAE